MKKQTLLLIFLFTACTTPPTLPQEDQLATTVAKTLTAHPIISFTQIPTLTPTATATVAASEPHVPYYTFTRAQNVNLRTQPGTLFPVSRVMAQGTRLEVTSLSLGGEWLYVFMVDEGVSGWVDRTFVEEIPEGRFDSINPQHCQVVSGRVLDSNGNPVSGIGFAIEQGTMRTDAATDTAGMFFAFLPESATGEWSVTFISIATTSNLMNSSCLNLGACGQTQPLSINVTLPTTALVTFIWE